MQTKEKVLIHKGMDKVKQGQYEEAVEIFDKVLSMNPQNTFAWNNRGVALFKADRPDDADRPGLCHGRLCPGQHSQPPAQNHLAPPFCFTPYTGR